jgi:Xaa-Pro aminopeptidase
MTIHVMPGIWTNSLGFECSETVVIKEKGYECLAQVPRELFVT